MSLDAAAELAKWGASVPSPSGTLADDARSMSEWHARCSTILPELVGRGAAVVRLRREWRDQLRKATLPFLKHHLTAVMEGLEDAGPREIIAGVGARFPWLVPAPEDLERDAQLALHSKSGIEYKLALLFAGILADAAAGVRLVESSRRPTARAKAHLECFRKTGFADFGKARVRRCGSTGMVELCAVDSLNAEDESVLAAVEACVDLVLLDERIEVGVLRGDVVQSARYSGKRVFCSGINLSMLYSGRIGYMYYLERELGMVSKIYRGLSNVDGREIEKPWIGVVDTHAIGGGCQLLLVMDAVLAERGANLTLPARREGILPGAANLRLPRLIGDLAARRVVMMDQPIPVESELGQLIVDRVVAQGELDDEIDRVAQAFTSSGQVSLAGNRKALRIGQEPLPVFVEYMAHFAVAQGDSHFSPALVANLENHWIARRESKKAVSGLAALES